MMTKTEEENKMRNFEIYRDAVRLWGEDNQLDMVVEECLELCHAILKYKRGKIAPEDVMEEIVDVYIVINEIKYVMHSKDVRIPSLFDTIYDKKMKRLEGLIKNDVNFGRKIGGG